MSAPNVVFILSLVFESFGLLAVSFSIVFSSTVLPHVLGQLGTDNKRF